MPGSYANKNSFSKALKAVRAARNLSQEAFGLVSSRTYVSSLERGMKAPTLNKIDEIATVLRVHPLTLLLLAYAEDGSPTSVDELTVVVMDELRDIGKLK